jgi:hypothetical protein
LVGTAVLRYLSLLVGWLGITVGRGQFAAYADGSLCSSSTHFFHENGLHSLTTTEVQRCCTPSIKTSLLLRLFVSFVRLIVGDAPVCCRTVASTWSFLPFVDRQEVDDLLSSLRYSELRCGSKRSLSSFGRKTPAPRLLTIDYAMAKIEAVTLYLLARPLLVGFRSTSCLSCSLTSSATV